MMSVNCAWKSSRLVILQCFYWVSDLIIRSYSFECCWTHNAHCLWQFKVVCYPYWWLHKVYLNVFMKIKDKTVKHIKNFVTLMKTDCSDYSLKHLHTDFECKYLVLKNWFTVNDIIWEPTVPYSPEENSVSERLNRTICELTSYAQRLWPELTPLMKAIKTAVYIKNQSSTWVLNMTLYEAWTGNISDLSSLYVFDIIAWAHIFKMTSARSQVWGLQPQMPLFTWKKAQSFMFETLNQNRF
jgi:hypothetical protein